MRIYKLLFLTFLCTIIACSKKSTTAVVTPKTIDTLSPDSIYVNVTNNNPVRTRFCIYSTFNDYLNDNNKVYDISLEASSSRTLLFHKNLQFYVDCFDSTYYYNNWSYLCYYTNGANISGSIIFTTGSNSNYQYATSITTSGIHSTTRTMLLKNNQIKTTWKIVDAYELKNNSYVSIFNSVAPGVKKMQLTFNKNFVMNFADGTGSVPNYMFNINSYSSTLSGTFFNTDPTATIGSFGNAFITTAISGGVSTPIPTPPYTQSVDSIGLNYSSTPDIIYIFARQ